MRPRLEPIGSRARASARAGRIFGVGTLCLISVLAACSAHIAASKGGPSGGPTSEFEPRSRIVTVGSDESALVDLPARLGTLDRPPTLVCSYTPDAQNWWFAFGDKTCFSERVLADGSLRVRIRGLEQGWIFRIDAFPNTS